MASSLHSPRVGFAETPLTSLERDAWELEDTKLPRDLTAVAERGLPGLYLSCFDMLVTEDTAWLLKVSETAPPSSSPRPEQCPVIDSQGLGGLSLGLDSQMEERSLEQVQSMVVGEVLKDIETACKLLNITPGKRGPCAQTHSQQRVPSAGFCVFSRLICRLKHTL